MAILKCKMCGGNLNITEAASIAECEFCGSVQTVPKVDDEKKLTLFARANRLRAACEFDKAAGIYEAIVADFPEEPEAYWGLVLCKYGIEYVDDPASGKKIPTCHRSGFDSVMKDSNVELAQEYADVMARRLYREEAKQIEELRKNIIAVSVSEEPYDVFICYKETDFDGKRTLDSVLAMDIYKALSDEGYRVFFSRISLEDKLGIEYEPYIFAALNSAKIMLVVGTDFEYFNAVWVKNEWSRFLKLMVQDKQKHLIPCYKGIDAYDMPEEFARLQAQDLDKMGAVQDIVHGVQKLLPKQTETAAAIQQPASSAMVTRGQFALEDGDWKKADEYFERALDENPRDGSAYLGKVLAALQLSSPEQIDDYLVMLHDNKDFDRAIRFSDGAAAKQLTDIRDRAHKKYLVKCVTVALKKQGKKLKQEEARIARQKWEEEQRIARERRWEEERIAREKQAEEERLAEEKRQKEAQIVAAQRREELRRANERLAPIREKIAPLKELIKLGTSRTIGLRANGTVAAVGYTCDGIEDWSDIVSIDNYGHAMGITAHGDVLKTPGDSYGEGQVDGWWDICAISGSYFHTVGLRTDGTVVAAGKSDDDACKVWDWKDVVAIRTDDRNTIGIRADGTVVSSPAVRKTVQGWTDIIDADVCDSNVIGLRSDGTVVGNYQTSQWTDIVAIACYGWHAVGLRCDGTVVAAGDNRKGECNVSDWTDIVAVSVANCRTIGLKSDGTVVAAGDNEDGACNVEHWRDVVAVFAGFHYTVGLKKNGTVVATGENNSGKCNVGDWKLFENYETIAQERIRHKETRAVWKSAGRCSRCGGQLKGLFSKKCVSCGKTKDY